MYYLDTSALVKLYVREQGTDAMLRLLSGPPGDQFAILALTSVEFRSAVRRRQRAGDIAPVDAVKMIEQFQHHTTSRYLRQMVSDAVLETALYVADSHHLRAYDAMQLAGCHALRHKGVSDPVFVCSDARLCDAAREDGFPTLNPAAA